MNMGFLMLHIASDQRMPKCVGNFNKICTKNRALFAPCFVNSMMGAIVQPHIEIPINQIAVNGSVIFMSSWKPLVIKQYGMEIVFLFCLRYERH